ncbi:MAG: hypothetical protein ACREMA_00875, partial [Longimicrobiales bacterium]
MNPPIGFGEAASATERRTIPYDYVFEFGLEGRPENTISKTLTVSIEAEFTAVGIGYGFILPPPLVFGPSERSDYPPTLTIFNVIALLTGAAQPPAPTLTSIPLGATINSLRRVLASGATPPVRSVLASGTPARFRRPGDEIAILRHGIQINPELLSLVETGANRPLDTATLARLFREVQPAPEQIQFLYALSDEATGRAFQNEPILNTAGLGIANGDRPFRRFSQPITFAPKAVIKLAITELSTFPCELHVALHGYRKLGRGDTPTGRALASAARPRPRPRRRLCMSRRTGSALA